MRPRWNEATKITFGVCLCAAIVLGGLAVKADENEKESRPPEVDVDAAEYKRRAEKEPFEWQEDHANIAFCMTTSVSPPDELELVRAADEHADAALSLRVLQGNREIFSSRVHPWTVFTSLGDVLYLARFEPIDDGCTVVAFDLRQRKTVWETRLIGIEEAVAHSEWLNRVTIDAWPPVFGKETGGRYHEYLDARTGKTLGHKRFPPEPEK